MAAVAAMAVYMQAVAGSSADPAPDPSVPLGALQIGLLQHATLLGFALAAFISGRTLGDDLQSGAFEPWRMTDQRRAGRWIRMVAAVAILLIASALLTAVVLCGWANAFASGSSHPTGSPVDVVQALTALAVIIGLACLAVAGATAIQNGVLLAMAAIVVFTLPMQLSTRTLRWLFPSRWIAEALFLTDDGYSVDYLNQRSLEISPGPARAVGVVLLVVVSTAAVALAARRAESNRTGAS